MDKTNKLRPLLGNTSQNPGNFVGYSSQDVFTLHLTSQINIVD